ncbi:MAG: hypothetical protein Q8L27_02385 [archaeon]|nr:hypothetical protein [archaeon]
MDLGRIDRMRGLHIDQIDSKDLQDSEFEEYFESRKWKKLFPRWLYSLEYHSFKASPRYFDSGAGRIM